MKRRFIAAVSGLDNDDQKKFIAFLRQNGAAWWHWIDDFWLMTDRNNSISATSVRDYLKTLDSSR